jgi:hypothetical protein
MMLKIRMKMMSGIRIAILPSRRIMTININRLKSRNSLR